MKDRVLNLMTHIDPYHRPDLDHGAVATAAPTTVVNLPV
jgi:hypothetical protein